MSAKRIKVKKERTLVVGQWIEVEVVDGVTKTTRYPDDRELAKKILATEEKKGRDVELVYRRLNFLNGVPPEYLWTTRDANRIRYGGLGLQRLRLADWVQQVLIEEGGHLRSSRFTMPRPESRGGCECEACLQAAKRIRLHGR